MVLVFVVIMMALVWGLDQVFGWLVLYVFGTAGGLIGPLGVRHASRSGRRARTEEKD